MRTSLSERYNLWPFLLSEIFWNSRQFLSLIHRRYILSTCGYTSSTLNLRKPCCFPAEGEIHFGTRGFSLGCVQTVIYHTTEFHVNIKRIFAAVCTTYGLTLSCKHPCNRNVWLDSCFLMYFLPLFTGVPTLHSKWQRC